MGVAGLVAELVVQQYLAAVSAVVARVVGDLHRAVARGVDGRAHVAPEIDARVGLHAVQDGVHAPRVEGADAVVAQRRAVDGPDGRYGGRHLALVVGEGLQLVERDRFEIERAGQRIELPPGALHQRRVGVALQRSVFLVGIGRVDPVDGQRVGRKERAVDEVVAVADVVHLALRCADAVLEDAVFDDEVPVFADDAVHLGRIEKGGEDHVGERHEDESDQDPADEPVGAQAERGRDDLAREHLRFAYQSRLLVRRLFFLCHPEKTPWPMVQI